MTYCQKRCWWCTYKFDNLSWKIPGYNGKKKYGNFCSANCCLRYLYEKPIDRKYMLIALLNIKADKKIRGAVIIPAGNIEHLDKYSEFGTSINEYRKNFII